MRVYQDASTKGKYFIDYRFHGRRLRYYAGSSLRAANTLRIRIESEINSGTHDPDIVRSEVRGVPSIGITLGELLDKFLMLYRSRGLSGYYEQRVKTYLRYWERGTPVSEIGPLQVEAFRNWCAENGHGQSTIRKNLISLGTIFRWAKRPGVELVTDNPAGSDVVSRPSESPAREVFLSHEQVRRLLEECDPDPRRLVHLIVETGMRLSEPLKLKWTDLDAKTGWIYVHEGKTKARKIPYTDLLQAIVGSRPRRMHSEMVFFDERNRSIKQRANELSKNIKAALKRIGMPEASAHSLRHTFASRLAARNVSLKIIAELLGISEVTAMRYAHLTPQALQTTMRQMHDHPEAADGDEESNAGGVPGGS